MAHGKGTKGWPHDKSTLPPDHDRQLRVRHPWPTTETVARNYHTERARGHLGSPGTHPVVSAGARAPGGRGRGGPGRLGRGERRARERKGEDRELGRAGRTKDRRLTAPPPHCAVTTAAAAPGTANRHPERAPYPFCASPTVRIPAAAAGTHGETLTAEEPKKSQPTAPRIHPAPAVRSHPAPRAGGLRHHVAPPLCQRIPLLCATCPASPPPCAGLSAQAQARLRFPPLRRRRAPPTAVGHIDAGGGGEVKRSLFSFTKMAACPCFATVPSL